MHVLIVIKGICSHSLLETNVQLTCHQFEQIKIWNYRFLIRDFGLYALHVVGFVTRFVALATVWDGTSGVRTVVEIAVDAIFSGCLLVTRCSCDQIYELFQYNSIIKLLKTTHFTILSNFSFKCFDPLQNNNFKWIILLIAARHELNLLITITTYPTANLHRIIVLVSFLIWTNWLRTICQRWAWYTISAFAMIVHRISWISGEDASVDHSSFIRLWNIRFHSFATRAVDCVKFVGTRINSTLTLTIVPTRFIAFGIQIVCMFLSWNISFVQIIRWVKVWIITLVHKYPIVDYLLNLILKYKLVVKIYSLIRNLKLSFSN